MRRFRVAFHVLLEAPLQAVSVYITTILKFQCHFVDTTAQNITTFINITTVFMAWFTMSTRRSRPHRASSVIHSDSSQCCHDTRQHNTGIYCTELFRNYSLKLR